MKNHSRATFFLFVTFIFVLIPLWSWTYAEDTVAHKHADSTRVRSNIVGKVADAQGNPLAKVKVTVLDPQNREIVARGVSNAQGEYVIECLDPREYYLELSALPERFVGQTVVVNLGKDGQIVQWAANAEVPAVATTRVGGGVCGCGTGWLSKKDDDERSTVSRSNIVGKVVDAQGNPMEKVKVTVFDSDNQEIIARRITDDKGNYAIECLDARTYNLVLEALPTQFLTRNAAVDLGKDGLDVHWAANQQTLDIDTAKMDGVCSCAAALASDGSQAGAALASPAGAGGTFGTVATVGTGVVVIGGGVSLGILLSGDSGGSGGPPSPASPSR
jgi:hypothetical protein